MAGGRELSENEVKTVRRSFRRVYKQCNEVLFVLGIKAVFQIAELLSLQVK